MDGWLIWLETGTDFQTSPELIQKRGVTAWRYMLPETEKGTQYFVKMVSFIYQKLDRKGGDGVVKGG